MAKPAIEDTFAPMFVRLTRRMRAKAGWFVALLYLFCVLAPGAALALGDAAPCFPTESTPAVTHMHEHSARVGASHEHGGHQADAGHAKHTHDGKTSDGKTTSPGPCCVMLCLSAIPANLPDIANPPQPISVRVSENYQRLPGKAPPLLYRPPIA